MQFQMDFLSFETSRIADVLAGGGDASSKVEALLGEEEVLQELRVSSELCAFFEANASLVVEAALARDGLGGDDEDTVEVGALSASDGRAAAAAEILGGGDTACRGVARAAAADPRCWAAIWAFRVLWVPPKSTAVTSRCAPTPTTRAHASQR